MKKIDVILMCYGKDALERNFEIKEKRSFIYCMDGRKYRNKRGIRRNVYKKANY